MKSGAAPAFALLLGSFALVAHAVPPGTQAFVRESASRLVMECAPERHDEFVERFERIVLDNVGPTMDEHFAKLKRSRDSMEAAREDYIGCLRDARQRELVLREACAAQHDHFLEREATVRALRSRDTQIVLTRKVALPTTRALMPLARDFPECDLRRLKTIGREIQ